MPLSDKTWNTLQHMNLTLDGTETHLRYDRSEVERFYMPLAERLIERYGNRPRTLIGIAGPPGSGKTAFATLLTAVIHTAAGEKLAALVGMDGWHFPNAYLDSHTILLDGQNVPLRRIKGRPETFDTQAIAAALHSLREGRNTPVPVYSRALHAPIPGGAVSAAQRLVLLEGNYWLLDEAPWCDFHRLFDFTIFLKAKREDLLAALFERHTRTGKSPQAAQAQIENADLPDIERVLSHSLPADVVVTKSAGWRIASITFGERKVE